MIRSRYLSPLAIAAMLGAAPAFAQNSATQGANDAESKPTAGTTGSAMAPLPLCSELNHPNAGQLADKDTGRAKEHAASPVHQDCVPDSTSSPSTTSSNSMDSTGTFSVNPAFNVNPNVGVDANVGVSKTDINAGATTDPTSTATSR